MFGNKIEIEIEQEILSCPFMVHLLVLTWLVDGSPVESLETLPSHFIIIIIITKNPKSNLKLTQIIQSFQLRCHGITAAVGRPSLYCNKLQQHIIYELSGLLVLGSFEKLALIIIYLSYALQFVEYHTY